MRGPWDALESRDANWMFRGSLNDKTAWEYLYQPLPTSFITFRLASSPLHRAFHSSALFQAIVFSPPPIVSLVLLRREGAVEGFDPLSDRHTVAYDCGDVETADLSHADSVRWMVRDADTAAMAERRERKEDRRSIPGILMSLEH